MLYDSMCCQKDTVSLSVTHIAMSGFSPWLFIPSIVIPSLHSLIGSELQTPERRSKYWDSWSKNASFFVVALVNYALKGKTWV
jgi:hypothetical protein